MKGVRFFQTIQIKLIIIYVSLILIAMQLIGLYFIKTLEHTLTTNFTANLNTQAYLLAKNVESYLAAGREAVDENRNDVNDELNAFVYNWASTNNAEIQIIDVNAAVISTSQRSGQPQIGQKNTQVEVIRALQGLNFNESPMIDTGHIRKKIIAKPLRIDNKVIGAVYIEASMEEMFSTMGRINGILISGTMIALAFTAVLGIVLSSTITNPIKEITRRATAMAEGNFDQQVKVLAQDEIGQLGKAFNYMTNRLKEALSLNEEEKEKLASILSNMSDGVIATDEAGKVIVMNQRATQMLRVEDAGAVKDVAELLEMSREQIDTFVFGKENTTVIQLPLLSGDEMLVVKVTFTAIQRSDEGISGTIAVLQDVTQQEKMERSRKEFVANVSHELRTPLTTIKSYLEALEDGAIDEPQVAHRFVGVTRSETERMIRLVNDLLQLSRLDSEQAIIRKEPTDVEEMLEEVADRFSFQALQRTIDIQITLKGDVGLINLDRDQIDQVLDNLVSNSIKYTVDGGTIELHAQREDTGWLEISVSDTGIGIPPKDLNRIFERFYRVDKARSRGMGGTGLGLSIAREIIKAHGGSMMLESEFNKGTKVTFSLPTTEEGSVKIHGEV